MPKFPTVAAAETVHKPVNTIQTRETLPCKNARPTENSLFSTENWENPREINEILVEINEILVEINEISVKNWEKAAEINEILVEINGILVKNWEKAVEINGILVENREMWLRIADHSPALTGVRAGGK